MSPEKAYKPLSLKATHCYYRCVFHCSQKAQSSKTTAVKCVNNTYFCFKLKISMLIKKELLRKINNEYRRR
jgi:hypothetical protein